MFTVELYAAIRRAVMADGLSRREAAKRFGVHRNTITKMLQYSIPPGYRRRERPVSKKLGPYMAWIDKILEGDRSVHKKQRHTAKRIFERLRDEARLCRRLHDRADYVARARRGRARCSFRSAIAPGQAQADFGEGGRLHRRREGAAFITFAWTCRIRTVASSRPIPPRQRKPFAMVMSRRSIFSAACRSRFYTTTLGSRWRRS